MLKDGTYSAWFRTPLGEGTGIVLFENGAISGGDSIMSYDGRYDVFGDRLVATVVATRHTEGHETVFGTDDLEISIEGICAGTIVKCTGIAAGAPRVVFEATLILRQQVSPETTERPLPKFDPRRLPKLTKRSGPR